MPEADAADFYWIGGDGYWAEPSNWADDMGVIYDRIPGADDNVIFNQNSFPDSDQIVRLPVGNASCKNFTWTNITSLKAPTLHFQSMSTLNVYGTFSLDKDMKVSYISLDNAKIVMQGAEMGTTLGVFGAGVALPNIEFNAPGGKWGVTRSTETPDTLKVNGTLKITEGNFSSSDAALTRYVSANNFVINGANASADLSNMDITAKSQFLVTQVLSITNQVLADTSSIKTPQFSVDATGPFTFGKLFLTGNTGVLDASGQNITFLGEVSLEGTSKNTILGAHTFANKLILYSAGSINELEAGSTQTFTGNGTIVGRGANCENYHYLQSTEAGNAALLDNSTGSIIQVSRFYLKDVRALLANQFEATISIDLGNTNNWAILEASAKTYRWINGTGDWSDGDHWLLVGGTSGCLPTALDDVIFDETSFSSTNQTVTVDLPEIYFNNMTWEDPQQGGRDRPTWSIPSGEVYIGGSLTLAPTMNVSAGTGVNFNFVAESGDHTVTATDDDGDGFDLKNIIFDGGGSWTLGGAMYASVELTFTNGTFNTSSSNHNFEATTITVEGNGVTLTLNDSEIFSTNFNIQDIGTLNADDSNIYTAYFNIDPALALTFNELILRGDEGVLTGTNLTFLDVTLSNNIKSTVYGSHTYNGRLQFDKKGMIVEFEAGTTQQIADLAATGGDCGEEIIVRTTQNGSAVNFVATDGGISVTGIIIQDNVATPEMAFSASASQNLGNVSGWDFTSMAQTRYFYWRGDTGDWNDGSNWRYTDTPGGNPTTPNCIPTPSDDVFFDEDSFKDPNEVITLNGVEQYCRNMTWGDDITGLPTMNIPAGNSLNIYGSLRLANTGLMALSFGDGEDATLEFKASTTGNTINPSGQVIPNLEFDGAGGAWSFSGVASLEVGNTITVINGTLNTNGIDIMADQFVLDGANAGATLGASELTIVKKFDIQQANPMNFDAGTSIITTNILESEISGITYSQVNLIDDSDDEDSKPSVNGNGLIFDALILSGITQNYVHGSHQFNTLLQFDYQSDLGYNPYTEFIFDAGSTQTFATTADIVSNSDNTFFSNLLTSSDGSTATFLKNGNSVCMQFIRIFDIQPAGGASFGYNNTNALAPMELGWIPTENCEAFLPVDCIDFAAAVQTDNSVELYWITAQEVNNDGFEVQRSTNGRSFETIAWIDGAGTTSEAQKYTFVDSRTDGLTEAYYRIRQIDFDGTAAFACDIQAVNFRAVGSGPVQVFPNPAGSQVQVRWYGRKDGTTIIRLFDQSGRLVLDREWNTLEGNNQRELPINELPQGIYELQVVSEHGVVETARLIKQ